MLKNNKFSFLLIVILFSILRINSSRKYKKYSKAYKAGIGIGYAEFRRIQKQKMAAKIRKNRKKQRLIKKQKKAAKKRAN